MGVLADVVEEGVAEGSAVGPEWNQTSWAGLRTGMRRRRRAAYRGMSYFTGTRNTPLMHSGFRTAIWICVFSRKPEPG